MDMEKVIKIIDELIFEAQKELTWKTENALRCLKKELLKKQEAVEPIITPWLEDEDSNIVAAKKECGNCGYQFFTERPNFCENCGTPILWEGR